MRAPTSDRRLALSVAALPEHIRELREAARGFAELHGVARPGDVALAVGEAVANVVVHAYRDGDVGPVRLTATRQDSQVKFVVEDQGLGLAPRVDGPGLGVGIGIMATVAARFSIDSDRGGGTTVQMAFEIPTARADGKGDDLT